MRLPRYPTSLAASIHHVHARTRRRVISSRACTRLRASTRYTATPIDPTPYAPAPACIYVKPETGEPEPENTYPREHFPLHVPTNTRPHDAGHNAAIRPDSAAIVRTRACSTTGPDLDRCIRLSTDRHSSRKRTHPRIQPSRKGHSTYKGTHVYPCTYESSPQKVNPFSPQTKSLSRMGTFGRKVNPPQARTQK